MLPGCDQVLPGCDQVLPGVTRHGVLAYRKWQVKSSIGSSKKIVLGLPSQDQRAEQNMVVTYDYSAAIKSEKNL